LVKGMQYYSNDSFEFPILFDISDNKLTCCLHNTDSNNLFTRLFTMIYA
jgi:hypothetical protein